jgi:tRNA(adenine34) deaminase
MNITALSEDSAFMRLALEEAQCAAAAGEVPIGAVLVLDGTVAARGHNRRESWQDPTAHAEMIAIRGAAAAVGSWRLVKSILYVTMEPCAMCIGAAILARIARVVYAAPDPKGGACGSVLNIPVERRLNHRLQVQGDVLSEESRLLLQEFFQQLRESREGAGLGRPGAGWVQ